MFLHFAPLYNVHMYLHLWSQSNTNKNFLCVSGSESCVPGAGREAVLHALHGQGRWHLGPMKISSYQFCGSRSESRGGLRGGWMGRPEPPRRNWGWGSAFRLSLPLSESGINSQYCKIKVRILKTRGVFWFIMFVLFYFIFFLLHAFSLLKFSFVCRLHPWLCCTIPSSTAQSMCRLRKTTKITNLWALKARFWF